MVKSHTVGNATHALSLAQRNGVAAGQPFNARQLLSVVLHAPSQHFTGATAGQPLATVVYDVHDDVAGIHAPFEQRV